MSFQIHALPAEEFAPLFQLSDHELRRRNMHRQIVTTSPGTPCRVSLADAEVGDTVILLNHAHQPADSPYQASHAIFVREGAQQCQPKAEEVPDVIRARLISVRMFDDSHMMVDADVVEGGAVANRLKTAFADSKIAYIHLHNAKPGCFAASVTRAG